MSPIRIVLGVIAGSCLVAALLAAATRFPAAGMFVFFGTAGAAILLVYVLIGTVVLGYGIYPLLARE